MDEAIKKFPRWRALALALITGGAVVAACSYHKREDTAQPPLGESAAPSPVMPAADRETRAVETAEVEPLARDAGVPPSGDAGTHGGSRDAGAGGGSRGDASVPIRGDAGIGLGPQKPKSGEPGQPSPSPSPAPPPPPAPPAPGAPGGH
jgi:hypothetical protein